MNDEVFVRRVHNQSAYYTRNNSNLTSSGRCALMSELQAQWVIDWNEVLDLTVEKNYDIELSNLRKKKMTIKITRHGKG